ncbi:MAG: Rieske (2Fe-2S) protein [Planctomycetaceae bacterium]
MPDFLAVARIGDIPEGEGRSFPVNGRMIAVFHSEGKYSAIGDTCPHMGASLATGYVENNAVTCPWHAWRFCIQEGTWLDNPNPKVSVDCFPVRVQGDDILVEVPPPNTSPPPATAGDGI